jgi:hypothetical protein
MMSNARESLAVVGQVDFGPEEPGWLVGTSEGTWITGERGRLQQWALES